MAESVITLRVVRKGKRADKLLRSLGEEIGRDDLVADDSGVIRVRMPGRGPRSWDQVREGLDRSGSDWREWLHLSPRPSR